MTEYNISASIALTCNIDVEAENEEAAKSEAMGYFDNSANFESDYYHNICVTGVDIDCVNED